MIFHGSDTTLTDAQVRAVVYLEGAGHAGGGTMGSALYALHNLSERQRANYGRRIMTSLIEKGVVEKDYPNHPHSYRLSHHGQWLAAYIREGRYPLRSA
jgi:hypothetical protein